jgi:hypothetical protein
MRLFLILIIIIGSVLCLSDVREKDDEVVIEIARWRGNARGAVTLSFDDGYLQTHLSVIPILEKEEG